MKHKQYNWEHPNWPNFNYSAERLTAKAESLKSEYARSVKRLNSLPIESQQESLLDLLVAESYATSKIENIETDVTQLRSSLAKRLELPSAGTPRNRYAQGMADLVLNMRNSRADGLTAQLLFSAHELCMSGQSNSFGRVEDVGKYRTSSDDMLITNGAPPEKRKVFFRAPAAKNVPQQMNYLIQWFNLTNPKLIDDEAILLARVSVAHLWFESIHPFEDGNGRIGRAIADLALCQMFGHSVLLSISTELEANRSEYYAWLHKASGFHLDLDEWNDWFSDRVLNAQKTSADKLDISLEKHSWWQSNPPKNFNDRQVKAINRMFDFGSKGMEGGMTARKYQNLISTSKATATRDLADLEHQGVLTRNEGGGS